ncbi:hypothetical protein [Halostreptopolyspora alba]
MSRRFVTLRVVVLAAVMDLTTAAGHTPGPGSLLTLGGRRRRPGC